MLRFTSTILMHVYKWKLETPALAYKIFVRTWINSKGKIADYNQNVATKEGVTLKKYGYCFMPDIDEEICEKINHQFSQLRPIPRDTSGGGAAVRLDYEASELSKITEVQNLICNPKLYAIAKDYLGAEPVIDVLTAWDSLPSEEPDSNAAQMYHFDLDRISWVKVFLYLSDVDENSGPHCFVQKSHRGNLPEHLLNKGYSRHSDEVIQSSFAATDILEMVGKSGTLLLEDTSGLHKGKLVQKGHRRILQWQYSVSNFGANYNPIRVDNNLYSKASRLSASAAKAMHSM